MVDKRHYRETSRMSSKAIKKRKVVAAKECSEGGDNTAAGVEDIIAEMKAQMTRTQNKMNEIEAQAVSMQKEMDNAKARAVSMQDEMDSMKTRLAQFDEIEARCEYLERSMKVLIDEQKWEYSAPDIPESYWDERGFDQDYIEDMKNFLTQIKDVTCKLRSGSDMSDEWIGLGNEDSDATALLHENVF